MSNITLSVLGLYNYDDTLFDPMVVPDGVDKTNVLIPNLLSELAELEVTEEAVAKILQLIHIKGSNEQIKINGFNHKANH